MAAGPSIGLWPRATAAGILWINAAGNFRAQGLQRPRSRPQGRLPAAPRRLGRGRLCGSAAAWMRTRSRSPSPGTTTREEEDAGADKDLDLYVGDPAGRLVGAGESGKFPAAPVSRPGRDPQPPRGAVVLNGLAASRALPDPT